jgi:hypothetical protein
VPKQKVKKSNRKVQGEKTNDGYIKRILSYVTLGLAILGFWFAYLKPDPSIAVISKPNNIFDADFSIENKGHMKLNVGEVSIGVLYVEGEIETKIGGFSVSTPNQIPPFVLDPGETYTHRLPLTMVSEQTAAICITVRYQFLYLFPGTIERGFLADRKNRISYWVPRSCKTLESQYAGRIPAPPFKR